MNGRGDIIQIYKIIVIRISNYFERMVFHCHSNKSLVYESIKRFPCSLLKITGFLHLGGPDEESNFNLFARYAVLKTVVCTGTLIRTIDESISLPGVVCAPLCVTIEIFISVTLLNFSINSVYRC